MDRAGQGVGVRASRIQRSQKIGLVPEHGIYDYPACYKHTGNGERTWNWLYALFAEVRGKTLSTLCHLSLHVASAGEAARSRCRRPTRVVRIAREPEPSRPSPAPSATAQVLSPLRQAPPFRAWSVRERETTSPLQPWPVSNATAGDGSK